MKNKNVRSKSADIEYIARSQFDLKGLLLHNILIPVAIFALLSVIWVLILIIFSPFLWAVPALGIAVAIVSIVLYLIVAAVAIITRSLKIAEFCVSKVTVKDTALTGRARAFKKFNVPFSAVTKLEAKNRTIEIQTNIPSNKTGTKFKSFSVINVKNCREIFDAYSSKVDEISSTEDLPEIKENALIFDEPIAYA